MWLIFYKFIMCLSVGFGHRALWNTWYRFCFILFLRLCWSFISSRFSNNGTLEAAFVITPFCSIAVSSEYMWKYCKWMRWSKQRWYVYSSYSSFRNMLLRECNEHIYEIQLTSRSWTLLCLSVTYQPWHSWAVPCYVT